MIFPLALLPGVIGVAAALPVAGIVVFLVVRHRRRRAAQRLLDDPDFELVFPEHPDDKPVRGTVAGRRITRR